MSGPDGQQSDRLALCGVLALATIAAATWLTGQTAGLLFGRDWISVGLVDLLGILTRLPSNYRDPASAWPMSAQRALPGPVGMYVTHALVLVGLGAMAGIVIDWVTGVRAAQPFSTGARWASARQLRSLLVRRSTADRIVLGRIRRPGLFVDRHGIGVTSLVAAERCHSVLVLGPTGSFKTHGLVVPAILEWHGPLVATSVKPDLLEATYRQRAASGDALLLDPFSASGRPSARWSPLAACTTYADAQAVAAAVSAAHLPAHQARNADAEWRYWAGLAEKLLAPILFAAETVGASMSDVVRWIDLRDQDDEVHEILDGAADDLALTAWEASLARDSKPLDSVFSTAEDLVRVYADSRLTRFTADNDLDVNDFLTGDNTVYLYAPPHEQRRLRPVFETISAQIIRTAQERAARSPGGMLDPKLFLALDEAGNVAALADLPELATTARAQGIQLLTVWHDKSQLEHRYGQQAATVLNNHRARVFLSGLADLDSLDLASRLVGEQTTRDRSSMHGDRGQRTASVSTTYRLLAPVESLRRLRPREGIVLYGHLPPARIRLRPWFDRRERLRRRLQWRDQVSIGQRAGRRVTAQPRELVSGASYASERERHRRNARSAHPAFAAVPIPSVVRKPRDASIHAREVGNRTTGVDEGTA
jgi:type IV secretion system protein VirD4